MIFEAWASQWKAYIASVPDVTDKVPVPGKLTIAGEVSGDQTDSISPVEHDIVVTPGDSCPTCGRPMPMTGAQRQAKYRAKERNG